MGNNRIGKRLYVGRLLINAVKKEGRRMVHDRNKWQKFVMRIGKRRKKRGKRETSIICVIRSNANSEEIHFQRGYISRTEGERERERKIKSADWRREMGGGGMDDWVLKALLGKNDVS